MSSDIILCDSCAWEKRGSASPTGAYSVDGCDYCADKSAGHQVYTTTEAPTAAEIQADIDWAFEQTALDVAKLRPRDSLPLAAYRSGGAA